MSERIIELSPNAPQEMRLRRAMAHRSRVEGLLCAAVETAADELPRFEAKRYHALADALRGLAAGLENHSVINLLSQEARPWAALVDEEWRRRADQLLTEERADAALALELTDALERVTRENQLEHAACLGYMMRGFFDNRRRHLVWAQEALGDWAKARPPHELVQRVVAETEAFAEPLRVLSEAS